ncbi:beta-glucoside-specific PTS transporter subunit IIABC [Marinilactibacillus piezotolerans]|uniref:beta-glucoside-specific PTS transporter subunit IIABC n=1 Tax=Marinilactibacillus piezotolerans TaxID=258723 RepID=UPI0009B04811|nr:beta-glucoside-specific PTS transporter subunit IIABC [Marinilactibacillus piezotolerans]
MDYQKTASEIVKNIGGKENVAHLEHCSTRLRFTLNDDSQANIDQLELIDGVMGVRKNVQTQVIIGNDVVEVYDEVKAIVGNGNGAAEKQNAPKQKWSAVFLDFIIGVFQPTIPAVAGGGILRSLLLLFDMLGWMESTSETYQVLDLIGSAPLYFLPIIVAITTANKLKVNAVVAASAVGALLLPGMVTLLGDGVSLLSIPLQNITYSSQVFPAILLVLFYAVLEKFFTKISPKAIRIFFVPLMSLAISVTVTLLVLGPIGYVVGEQLSAVILFIFENVGWVATGLLAAVLPFMVVTGMHKAMIPYAVSSMSGIGRELLYLPASLAHNISESGACFAVAIKTKDEKLRATAISAGISAFFGITEPALYGVTILHKPVLYSVIISSLISGSFIGIMAVEAFALVGPGFASITMFANPDNPMNIVWAGVTFVLSLFISFVAVLVLWKDEKKHVEEAQEEFNTERQTTADMNSPVEGTIIPLSDVNDEVFSKGLVGSGFAVQPATGELRAPAKGSISMVFDTKHAVGMKLNNGAELLFHIGIDTVQLEGKPFTAHVKAGDTVNAGDLLVSFDIDAIKKAGYDSDVIVVVTNQDDYAVDQKVSNETVLINQSVMTVSPIGG